MFYQLKEKSILHLRRWFGIGFLFIYFILSGCATRQAAVSLPGIQNANNAFARAKIAVLSCRSWPHKIYRNQPSSSAFEEAKTSFCTNFDKFIIDGFKNQKFMNGASPKGVLRQLQKNKATHLLDKLKTFEPNTNSQCANCYNPIDYYKSTLGINDNFRQFLNTFSRNCAYVDTILLPVLFTLDKSVIDDRGLFKYEISAEVGIYLIDTNSGELIWYGGNKSSLNNSYFSTQTDVQKEFPNWDLLMERIFTNGVWKDFPGREQL